MNSLSCVMAAGDGAGARVEATAQGLVGIHVPHAVLDSEAHGLVVEGLTEALRPVVPSNGARAADATDLALARIARGRPAGGNRTGGRGDWCQRDVGVASCRASCGRPWVYVCTNGLTTCGWRLAFAAAGLVAFALSPRCLRSWAPFSGGLAGVRR